MEVRAPQPRESGGCGPACFPPMGAIRLREWMGHPPVSCDEPAASFPGSVGRTARSSGIPEEWVRAETGTQPRDTFSPPKEDCTWQARQARSGLDR